MKTATPVVSTRTFAASIADPAAGDADHGGGGVVAGVEQQRDLNCSVVAVSWFEQFRGAETQQRCGHIADLERARTHQKPPEPAAQHRPHAKPDRLPLV
jgi:hypothetical protein